MAIRSSKNQYAGINAHYQSHAQNEPDGWATFHHAYITELAAMMQDVLPPGYEVSFEQSLQLRILSPSDEQKDTFHTPIPDLTVFHDGSFNATQAAETAVATPILTTSLLTKPDEEDRIMAVVIYQVADEEELVPIVRIELLSPTNKTGRGLEIYWAKRDVAVRSGVVLVELDYLHETPSLVADLHTALPYLILVTDPREIITKIYGFHVDEAFLPVEVPLVGTDKIPVDFLAVYRRTYERFRWFYRTIDYAKEPPAMHTYSRPDQLRVWGRMLAVLEAVKAGQELNNAPFPLLLEHPLWLWLQQNTYPQACLLIDEATLTPYALVHQAQEQNHAVCLLTAQGQLIPKAAGEEAAMRSAFLELKTAFHQQGVAALGA